MEANFVILPSIKIDDIELAVHDEEIRTAAVRYVQAQKRADELKATAEDRLLAGSPGTIYLKKLGHRPLSTEDVHQIIGALGTEDEKKSLSEFSQAQEWLSQRLKPISQYIKLILDQAEVPYFQYYKRLQQPELWKAEQMIAIIDVLERLRV